MSFTSSDRAMCWKCHRAARVCLCEEIRPFEWGPRLILLVHPKESRKTIGTVRIVHRSVQDSVLIQGWGRDLDSDPEFQALVNDPALYPVVLYPGQQSVNLSRMSETGVNEWLPLGRRLAVIVVDGSWSLAQKMVRTSRTLSRLPQVSFDPRQRSTYTFRRQPAKYCLSSLEAVVELMEVLARFPRWPLPRDRVHENMNRVFANLVQIQLSHGGVE